MRALFTILLLTLFSLCGTAQALDGRSFSIELTKIGGLNLKTGHKWKEDVLVFENGTVLAKLMEKEEGFGPAKYDVQKGPEDEDWVTEFSGWKVPNKYVSSLKIEGKVVGDKIEGTAVWTNKQGEHTYSFEGAVID